MLCVACMHGSSSVYLRTTGSEQHVRYKVVSEHLETFLASLDADPEATGLPAYVQ
jgi:hypothetical protein